MADLYRVDTPSTPKIPDRNAAAARRRRALRKRKQQRLLYRCGFTPDEIRRLVLEIGPMRVLGVIDELTQPQLLLVAAE